MPSDVRSEILLDIYSMFFGGHLFVNVPCLLLQLDETNNFKLLFYSQHSFLQRFSLLVVLDTAAAWAVSKIALKNRVYEEIVEICGYPVLHQQRSSKKQDPLKATCVT